MRHTADTSPATAGRRTLAPTSADVGADAVAASAPVPSDDLLQGRKAVEISHNGSVYRLQATKLGKLILTK